MPAQRRSLRRVVKWCAHAEEIRDVTPSALGCEECLKTGEPVGSSAAVPDLRARRLLRQLAEPPRHRALPRHRPSDHRRLRSAGRLGLVLLDDEFVKLDHRRRSAGRSRSGCERRAGKETAPHGDKGFRGAAGGGAARASAPRGQAHATTGGTAPATTWVKPARGRPPKISAERRPASRPRRRPGSLGWRRSSRGSRDQ